MVRQAVPMEVSWLCQDRKQEWSDSLTSELTGVATHNTAVTTTSAAVCSIRRQREEISTSPSAAPLEEAVGCDEVTPQPSLLQAEQAKHPKLHTVLEVGLHQCSVEWDNHLPRPASYAVLDAPQDTVGPFGCQGTRLTHIQLAINPNPQVSFRGAALQPLVPQFVCIPRITPSQVQNLALALVKFHTVGDCQLSSLSRSLCKASLPSRESTAPPSLVSSANLLNVHLIPAPRSFMKTLKRTGPKIEPWGTPLLTGRQPDVHKKLGGGTAKTIDPNWPKVYSMPYGVMLSIETGGSWRGGSSRCLGTGWALLPVNWDLSRLPRLLKSNGERSHNSIGQLFQYPGMNPIGPHRLMCIQLEQQVSNKFRVGWEFIIPPVMVFQHRALGVPGPIINVEDRGKEGIERLCFVCVPICEVTNLVKQRTNKITESQNRIGWKRPLRSSSPTVNLTLPRPPLYHVPKHLIQTAFKCFQGWRLNHFPGQPVPMLDNPFSEVKFPNIQSKPPLAQLEAISSCPITCYLGEETDPHLSTTSFQRAIRSPLSLLFSRLNSPSSLSRSSSDFCSRPFTSFVALLWTRSSTSSGGPKSEHSIRGAASPVPSTGDNHCPSPAGHAIFDTSQDAIGFLGHLGTLLAHIQAAVNQHPQVLLCQAAFQPLFPKPVALHGVAVAQVQDLVLGLVKPHTIGLSPSIQPVQVPLQSLPPLKQINTPAQLGVVCKLTEGALDPFIQIIDKDIKQHWPQHRALGNTACDRPPTGVNSIHHHSLGLAIQPVLYPAKSTPVQAVSSPFLQENAVGNRVKGFTEV
ncbi:hypothetical protein QYF61_001104 [Mycteria americana]|uniref:Uncharacterized protein n=1 Tax=Mycteria americana TaxID=33587 RepID=A0AAN7N7U2_MYCAM|nr:hypothetical protein QYF61_001104 [Mycteria americana]